MNKELKELDEVLQYIIDNNGIKPLNDVLIHFMGKWKIDSPYVSELVEKLDKDKYVLLYDKSMTGFTSVCRLTFEGRVFKIYGGYTGKKKKESISANLQLVTTWAIAVGTLGLLLFEIWKFYQEHWACCGCKK